jgi:site-specific recombinase XerD
VFLNTRGEPWTAGAVSHQLEDLLTRCGLADGAVCYGVRHQFGTAAVINGTNPLVVAQLLGSSVLMVEQFFTHLDDQSEFQGGSRLRRR